MSTVFRRDGVQALKLVNDGPAVSRCVCAPLMRAFSLRRHSAGSLKVSEQPEQR